MELMDVFIKAWQWVPWLMGFGAVGWIALAIFAPSVLLIVTPILQGIAQGIVEFIKVMYAGVTNILNSWQSIIAVAVIATVAANYGTFKEQRKHREEVAPLVQTEPTVAPQKVRRTSSADAKKVRIIVPTPPTGGIFDRSSSPVQTCFPPYTCEGAR